MDFKKYYGEQDLLEFTGGGAIEKVAQLAGKAVGGAFGLMGAGIKALAGGIGKVLKDVAGKIREPLKKKFDAALALAEEIYPYDKEIYDKIKADKSSAIREIDSYLQMAAEKSIPIKYSVGLDIVYKVYAETMAEVLKKDIDIKDPKLSIKTLEDGRKKVRNIHFPKMKDRKEVDAYFDANTKKDTSMLLRWIDTSSTYCMWKNKYSKNDDEGMETIVDQIQQSGILSRQSLDRINQSMVKLETHVPAIEVNVQNLEESFETDVEELAGEVSDLIENDNTTIKKEDIKIDQESITFLTKQYATARVSPLIIANMYVSMSRLIKKYNPQSSIMVVFESHTSFHAFFGAVTDKDLIEIQKSLTSVSDKKNLMGAFSNLNGDGVKTADGKIVKINDDLVNDINKLFRVIAPKHVEDKK